ncbi:MAG: hypothetical protein U0929_18655 [Planctomycetaceae bacterium]
MRTKSVNWMLSTLLVFAAWLAFGGYSTGFAQDAAAPAATGDASTNDAPLTSPAATPDAASPASATPEEKPKVVARPVVIPYQELTYRVSISVGVDPDSGLTNRDVQRVVTQLTGLVESRIGKWWSCEVGRAVTGEPLNRAMLEHRTAASWNSAMETTNFDKKFVLTIDRVGTEFRVSGVEWDRASQSISSVQSRQSFDRRLLATLGADVVFEVFRPLVSIDTVTEGNVEMRVRGGEFLPPDVRLMPFEVGDHVNAFLRHLGKNKELKRLQSIPWTTIRIDMVERSYLRGTIVSAFKSPLTVSRRRVEMLGMKIQTMHPSTRLRVIPRGKPQAPMAGYRVEILNRPETKEDKVEDRVTMRTDRKGEIVIPADAEKPLRYLIVYSGTAPLAKAPLIPGYIEQAVLEAPDDAPRLNVEAETELLQSELVDIVARREVMMARARGASKNGDWELVSELQKKVAELPTLEQFQARIEALRNPAVQAAKRNKDKAQESRIVRMCKQIGETATQHLDPLKVKEFMDEIDEEKKAK